MKRLLLFSLLPAAAGAQAPHRCVDSLAGALWRQTPLMASVTDPSPGDRDRDRYVAGLLQALPRGYVDPGADNKPAMAVGYVQPADLRTPVHATLVIALDRNGHVLDVQMTHPTGKPALDAALRQAALLAGGSAGLGKMPRKLRGDTVRFTIAIDDRDAPAGAVAFGALSSAYLEADTPPRIVSMPPARAPRGHRGKRVVLAGTVGADGHVQAPTVRVVSSTDSILTAVARSSFERTLFRPGTKHGCPAEATIRQVFPFP